MAISWQEFFDCVQISQHRRDDFWSAEDDRILTELWMLPELRAKDIGERMTPPRTKNGVIGRATRLALPPRRKRKGNVLPPHRSPRRIRRAIGVPQPMLPIFPEPQNWEPVRVPLLEAKWRHCRAIIESSTASASGQTIYCGLPIPGGQSFSFCRHHLKLYTIPPRLRRR